MGWLNVSVFQIVSKFIVDAVRAIIQVCALIAIGVCLWKGTPQPSNKMILLFVLITLLYSSRKRP